MRKSLFVAVALCFAVCQIAGAVNVPDVGILTIQDGVNAALDGESVIVADGTWAPFDMTGRDIVVISANGKDNCIILVGEGETGARAATTPVTARISGFTFQGTAGTYCMGIRAGGNFDQYGLEARLEIDNCTIRDMDQQGDYGAAISIMGGGNYDGSDPYIHDNLMLDNVCKHGGAIIGFECGDPLIDSNVFQGNKAYGLGGSAILYYAGWWANWVSGSGSVISNNFFIDNGGLETPRTDCAAIRARDGGHGVTIDHNSFYNNNTVWVDRPGCVELSNGYYAGWSFYVTNNLAYNNGLMPFENFNGNGGSGGGVILFGGNVTENLAGCFNFGSVDVFGDNLDITTMPFVSTTDLDQVAGAPSINYFGVATTYGDPVEWSSGVTVDIHDTARDATPDAGAHEAPALPTADAQCAAYAYEGSTLVLDGTGSILATSYSWTQTGGKVDALKPILTPTAALASIVTPEWDGSTELTVAEASMAFQLEINGGDDTDDCACYVRIPGDANGDDIVNAFDIVRLRTLHPEADFNGDGTINAFDLAILRQNGSRRRTE